MLEYFLFTILKDLLTFSLLSKKVGPATKMRIFLYHYNSFIVPSSYCSSIITPNLSFACTDMEIFSLSSEILTESNHVESLFNGSFRFFNVLYKFMMFIVFIFSILNMFKKPKCTVMNYLTNSLSSVISLILGTDFLKIKTYPFGDMSAISPYSFTMSRKAILLMSLPFYEYAYILDSVILKAMIEVTGKSSSSSIS